jgi:hypothetical protein
MSGVCCCKIRTLTQTKFYRDYDANEHGDSRFGWLIKEEELREKGKSPKKQTTKAKPR